MPVVIRELPIEVRNILRSGVVIPSASQCIVELILNSLDADATSIAIRVDLIHHKIQVVDNGCGMNVETLNLIGLRYMTSKCRSLSDLRKHLDYFGYRGEALASVRNVSKLLTIESRLHDSSDTYLKIFREGEAKEAVLSNLKRPSRGTTVTVHEFMYNMPVRRQRINDALDLEEIKGLVEAIALAHPGVSFSLRNDKNGTIILQIARTFDSLKTFSKLFGEIISQSLIHVTHSQVKFKVDGYISRELHVQKHLRFIYVNNRIIRKSKLHKLVNAMLAKSSILKPLREIPITKRRSNGNWLTYSPPSHRDKYPVFVLNIKCANIECDISLDPKKTLIEFLDWESILKCLEETVQKFLDKDVLKPFNEVVMDTPMKDLSCADEEAKKLAMEQVETDDKFGEITIFNIGRGILGRPAFRRCKTNTISGMDEVTGSEENLSSEVDAPVTNTTLGIDVHTNSDVEVCADIQTSSSVLDPNLELKDFTPATPLKRSSMEDPFPSAFNSISTNNIDVPIKIPKLKQRQSSRRVRINSCHSENPLSESETDSSVWNTNSDRRRIFKSTRKRWLPEDPMCETDTEIQAENKTRANRTKTADIIKKHCHKILIKKTTSEETSVSHVFSYPLLGSGRTNRAFIRLNDIVKGKLAQTLKRFGPAASTGKKQKMVKIQKTICKVNHTVTTVGLRDLQIIPSQTKKLNTQDVIPSSYSISHELITTNNFSHSNFCQSLTEKSVISQNEAKYKPQMKSPYFVFRPPLPAKKLVENDAHFRNTNVQTRSAQPTSGRIVDQGRPSNAYLRPSMIRPINYDICHPISTYRLGQEVASNNPVIQSPYFGFRTHQSIGRNGLLDINYSPTADNETRHTHPSTSRVVEDRNEHTRQWPVSRAEENAFHFTSSHNFFHKKPSHHCIYENTTCSHPSMASSDGENRSSYGWLESRGNSSEDLLSNYSSRKYSSSNSLGLHQCNISERSPRLRSTPIYTLGQRRASCNWNIPGLLPKYAAELSSPRKEHHFAFCPKYMENGPKRVHFNLSGLNRNYLPPKNTFRTFDSIIDQHSNNNNMGIVNPEAQRITWDHQPSRRSENEHSEEVNISTHVSLEKQHMRNEHRGSKYNQPLARGKDEPAALWNNQHSTRTENIASRRMEYQPLTGGDNQHRFTNENSPLTSCHSKPLSVKKNQHEYFRKNKPLFCGDEKTLVNVEHRPLNNFGAQISHSAKNQPFVGNEPFYSKFEQPWPRNKNQTQANRYNQSFPTEENQLLIPKISMYGSRHNQPLSTMEHQPIPNLDNRTWPTTKTRPLTSAVDLPSYISANQPWSRNVNQTQTCKKNFILPRRENLVLSCKNNQFSYNREYQPSTRRYGQPSTGNKIQPSRSWHSKHIITSANQPSLRNEFLTETNRDDQLLYQKDNQPLTETTKPSLYIRDMREYEQSTSRDDQSFHIIPYPTVNSPNRNKALANDDNLFLPPIVNQLSTSRDSNREDSFRCLNTIAYTRPSVLNFFPQHDEINTKSQNPSQILGPSNEKVFWQPDLSPISEQVENFEPTSYYNRTLANERKYHSLSSSHDVYNDGTSECESQPIHKDYISDSIVSSQPITEDSVHRQFPLEGEFVDIPSGNVQLVENVVNYNEIDENVAEEEESLRSIEDCSFSPFPTPNNQHYQYSSDDYYICTSPKNSLLLKRKEKDQEQDSATKRSCFENKSRGNVEVNTRDEVGEASVSISNSRLVGNKAQPPESSVSFNVPASDTYFFNPSDDAIQSRVCQQEKQPLHDVDDANILVRDGKDKCTVTYSTPNSMPISNINCNTTSLMTVNEEVTADNSDEATLSYVKELEHPDIEINDVIKEPNTINKEWAQRFDGAGKKFFVHLRSGMTSYEAPVAAGVDQESFSMTKRYGFLPKGLSPILQETDREPVELLSPGAQEAVRKDVDEATAGQQELLRVKWRVDQPGCGDLIEKLMVDSEKKMRFCESEIPNACDQKRSAVKVYNLISSYTFTKDIFKNVMVLGQLDNKFIVVMLSLGPKTDLDLLVLFDQHAVHERIRLEKLMTGYMEDGSDSRFKSTPIDTPFTITLTPQESRIVSSFRQDFERLGLDFQLVDTLLTITSVPTCVKSRERREPVGKRAATLHDCVESLVKEQARLLLSTRGVGARIPATLQNIVNSEACKGAIKFGDHLSDDICVCLLSQLSHCDLPFQCAHGRPSLVPIVNMQQIHKQHIHVDPKPNYGNLKTKVFR